MIAVKQRQLLQKEPQHLLSAPLRLSRALLAAADRPAAAVLAPQQNALGPASPAAQQASRKQRKQQLSAAGTSSLQPAAVKARVQKQLVGGGAGDLPTTTAPQPLDATVLNDVRLPADRLVKVYALQEKASTAHRALDCRGRFCK